MFLLDMTIDEFNKKLLEKGLVNYSKTTDFLYIGQKGGGISKDGAIIKISLKTGKLYVRDKENKEMLESCGLI